MFELWQTLAARLHGGERVLLALVVENTRHSPGTVGARLFVAEGGETRGTIGGGIMEHDLLQEAKEIFRGEDSYSRIRTLHHSKSASGERSGMICAGRQTNLYYLCRPEIEAEVVGKAAALVARAGSGTLRIGPRGMSIAEEPPDLARPQQRLRRETDGRHGDDWLYEEELLNRRRLALLGGGHCSLALARVMARLGYDVFAFEARKKSPEPGLGEHVRAVEVVSDFRDAGDLIDFPELTRVVVMTSDFPSDVRALSGVVGRPFPFIGVMGSPAKLRAILRHLEEAGFSRQQLAQLRTPVGLPIGSDTPEEIAISVAAQILQERNAAESRVA